MSRSRKPCWTCIVARLGCEQTFFSGLGFTESFFNSPTGLGIDGFSSLLSSGSTVTVTESAPEPASMAIFLAGLAGAGLARRRRG